MFSQGQAIKFNFRELASITMMIADKKRSCARAFTSQCHMYAAAVLLLICLFLAGCSNDATGKAQAEDPRKKMALPVTVAAAVQKTVPVQLLAIGNVESYSKVVVKAQVAGEVTGVHFKEGQEVQKGDLLFTINPLPFEVELKLARANLAKDKAQLENARKQVDRYTSVVKKGYVSAEEYDKVRTDARTLEASVQAYEAAVERAAIELDYCHIRSPINGHTSDIKVDAGNLMKANDNDKPMVIIRQTNPIYVVFTAPEKYLPEIRKQMATKPLQVKATIPGQEQHQFTGELTFVDNSVDTTTGTIQLKATIANEDKALWPGQFVSVTLVLEEQPGALVIPSRAVQMGQQGSYVFVVKPDSSIDYRTVTVGRSVGEDVVVQNGISAGDKVVTDGQLRLFPGALVRIVESE
jgi:membrane fusion protein, multidrug efflux system